MQPDNQNLQTEKKSKLPRISFGFVTGFLGDKSKRRRLYFAGLICLLATAGLTWLYMQYDAQQKEAERDKKLVKITKTEDIDSVVRDYGASYGVVGEEIRDSNYAKWDKKTLDKAYFTLLYADRVGSFSQVYDMLASIDLAKKTGLDIDDNSYGVNQEQRDAIKQRADKAFKEQADSATNN